MLLRNQRDHQIGLLHKKIAELEQERERLRNEALHWYRANMELHSQIKKLKQFKADDPPEAAESRK